MVSSGRTIHRAALPCLLWSMLGHAPPCAAQPVTRAEEARVSRITRLAAECQQGAAAACREVLPILVGGRGLQPRVVDADTGASLPSPRVLPSPDVRPLALALMRAVRLSAASGTLSNDAMQALAAEFPRDPTLASAAREQLLARGDDAWLRGHLCQTLSTIDPIAALRRHPVEAGRPDFVRHLAECFTALPLEPTRPRWAAAVEALGPEASRPLLDAWVDAEIAALTTANPVEQIAAVLRALPAAGATRFAEAAVASLRANPAVDRAMIDSLASAFPGQESFMRYQSELTAEAARRAASEAEDRARETAEGQRRAAREAEDQARAAAARQAEEQRQRAAAAARECGTRCQATSDACATAHPEQLFNRCLREFEQCQVRCQR